MFRRSSWLSLASLLLCATLSAGPLAHASTKEKPASSSSSSGNMGTTCASSSSSSGGLSAGTFYPANSEQGCTGKKKCSVHPWGVALQNNTGFVWTQIDGGVGGEAAVYLTAASNGGVRSMSVWINDIIVDVLTVDKKVSPRPTGSTFGPFLVYLNPGVSNKVELRDTESGPGLDVIGLRVIPQANQPDADNDGVSDALDLCPSTPAGTAVDSHGCPLVFDEDRDGTPDSRDQCPFTPVGTPVDENGCEILFGDADGDGFTDNVDLCIDIAGAFFAKGCPADFYDQDNDGVPNRLDRCAFTSPGSTVNSEGCSSVELTRDSDKDGVQDFLDFCPGTHPADGAVNATGCSSAQLNDDDSDGVINAYDLCPAEIGFSRLNGCPLEKGLSDSDKDGIPNDQDLCPLTPPEWLQVFGVAPNGCIFGDPNFPFNDLDKDGIADIFDNCPSTEGGALVNGQGCSYSQLDGDFDGVENDLDICPNTPRFSAVDAVGCADDEERDSDRDGVADQYDLCPSTPLGLPVDSEGCSEDADFDGLTNQQERDLGTDPYKLDTDGDGLTDGDEVIFVGTDPLRLDTDGGGVGDGDERIYGLNPRDPADDLQLDSDFDQLTDAEERALGTDPFTHDTDGDGLSDGSEVKSYSTNPLISDTDGGGVVDGTEVNRGLNPLDRLDDRLLDSDSDGLSDFEELELGTIPYYYDSDFDGLSDGHEVKIHRTNPLLADSDQGGVADGHEINAGMNPLDPSDDLLSDLDNDGLNVQQERELGTDPFNSDSDYDDLTDGHEVNLHNTNPQSGDTDGGGVRDGAEVSQGLNPLDPSDDQLFDADLDGLPDAEEMMLGTYWWNPDSDYDGLSDGDEVKVHSTNPLLQDTDSGGASDGQEVNLGLNPLDASDDLSMDSDSDGLTDGEEVALGTSPFNSDSDYDGLTDGDEVKTHTTNPTLSDTDGGGESDGQEVGRGRDPLDPSDDAFGFPVHLYDGLGFSWDIQYNGGISDGRNDAFDGAFYIQVNDSDVDFDSAAKSSAGREVIITGERIPNLKVTRRVLVPENVGAARFIDSFTNTGDDYINISVKRWSNLGSDSSTQILATGTGDVIFGKHDSFVITDDGQGEPSGDPVITHLIQGAATDNLSASPVVAGTIGDSIQSSYRLTLRPGETISLVSLGLQRETFAESERDIAAMLQPAHPIWQGINPADVLKIANLFALVDADGDGLLDDQEILLGTDPQSPDTDGDGVNDRESVLLAFDSTLAGDSDADGVVDFLDLCLHSGSGEVDATGCLVAPTADTDGDGILDGEDFCPFTPAGSEVDNTGCPPTDSDGDGLSDDEELAMGTNPFQWDTDGDGLLDGQEVKQFNTKPLMQDTDGGGINDGVEVSRSLNPLDPADDLLFDSDFDGLTDSEELSLGTNPYYPDSDFDHLSDRDEVRTYSTNPLIQDTDGGGIGDGHEIFRDLNPLDPSDDLLFDSDDDGLNDADEIELGTDRFNSDSDLDGLSDGREVKETNTNPLSRDTDGGGVGDGDEIFRGFSPLDSSDDLLFDSDNDGLTDPEEIALGTNVYWYDSDFDNLSDGDEVKRYQTNPVMMDTDGGSVSDDLEVSNGLNPLDQNDDLFFDSDQDGLNDAQEIELGTDRFNSDSDFDGLSDGLEVNHFKTNPLVGDSDGGGVRDGNEVFHNLNPLDASDDQLLDSDYDTLTDAEELTLGTNPHNPDSDFDLLNDSAEVKVHNTNPLLRDSDGGGIGDGDEVMRGHNPLDSTDDVLFDWDSDGLSDREENELGTNPYSNDSDFDALSDRDEVKIYKTNPLANDTDAGGVRDGEEIAQGLNPLDPTDDQFIDSDLDGLNNVEESALGTSLFQRDSDYDGISDGDEVKVHFTNPLSVDTDGGGSSDGLEIMQGLNPLDPSDDQLVDSDMDGLNDSDESLRGTDPHNPDSDADGLLDGDEVNVHRTNPLLRDTDEGNASDGNEVAQGTDPLNPDDDLLQLPLVLQDGENFQWDIQPDGSIGDGTNNAFDGGFLFQINGQTIRYTAISQSEDKREIILSSQRIAQLKIERRVWVPRDLAFARFIDSVTNIGDQALNLSLELRTNLGSNGSTEILSTASGDTRFDHADSYLITDENEHNQFYGSPAVTHVFQGSHPEQLRLKPSEATISGDYVQMVRQVVLRPGETISLVTLGLQRHDLQNSQADVQEMLEPSHQVWTGLSPQKLLKIANVFAEVDSDSDGLLEDQEIVLGTNSQDPDSDFDGRTDRESVLIEADPTLAGDSDFDGIPDFLDMCIQLGDIDVGEDGCLMITDDDSDGDGVPDSFDACPETEAETEVFSNGCRIDDLVILSAQTLEVSLSPGVSPVFSIGLKNLTYNARGNTQVWLDVFDSDFYNLSGPGASIEVTAFNAGQTEYHVPVFLVDSLGNQSATFLVPVRVTYLDQNL